MVRSPRRVAGRLATAVSIAAAVGIALPASLAGAAPASPQPTLKELLAQAAKLSRQIDSMSQQYDALRIQYDEAKAQVKIAHLTVRRDERLLAADQAAIAQIAAAGYMTGGVNPAISLLESKNPQSMLNRASILGQLQRENGARLHMVTAARAAAQRIYGSGPAVRRGASYPRTRLAVIQIYGPALAEVESTSETTAAATAPPPPPPLGVQGP